MVPREVLIVNSDVIDCCQPLTQDVLSAQAASEFAQVFAALADPVRLRLLSLVAASAETCSCTLEAPLAKSQPTISHHTRILTDAGLIIGEKRGRWVYWRIVPERMKLVAALLES